MSARDGGFGRSLQAVRSALHLTQDQLGARLGVSRRTLTRWEIHDELPPIGQRKHIATSFPDVPHPLRAALVRSLGLHDSFAGPPPSPPAGDPASASASADPAVVDRAFLDLCERADVSPGRLRTAVVEFLRHVEAGGHSLASTRTHLAPRALHASAPSKRGK